MSEWFLPRDKREELLSNWMANRRFIAPTEDDGIILYRELKGPQEVIWDKRAQKSPKEAILPQTEELFRFRGAEFVPSSSAGGRVLFGVRPCEARAFKFLDLVFGAEPQDPYYLQMREDTIIVGFSCIEPTPYCFCPSTGGGPGGTEGLDLLFTEIEGGYYVGALTEGGEVLLGEVEALLTAPSPEQRERKEEVIRQAEANIRQKVDLEGIAQRLEDLPFEAPLWEELGRRCLRCGICTYLCPTCHCFDIQDESTTFGGCRVRVWDSCQFPEFTLEASGHNPRPTRKVRLRNRFYHKFFYFPEDYGPMACVGCGRCVEFCPVNIDLVEVLSSLR